MTANPLLLSNSLSDFVPFDKIKDEHFVEAFDIAMSQHRSEISSIIDKYSHLDAKSLTVLVSFLEDLEKSGRRLRWIQDIFYNLNSCLITPTRQKMEIEYLPKFQAHKDSVILMNHALFEIVKMFHQNLQQPQEEKQAQLFLDPESRRLLSKYYDDFLRCGANLKTDQERTTLKKLNEDLSILETKFQQAVLAESASTFVFFENEAELDGLSTAEIAEAKKHLLAATGKGLANTNENNSCYQFAIKLSNATCQTHLFKHLKKRESRRKIYEASILRGKRGNESDNRETVIEITKKRNEKATLVGYKDFANFALSREMVGSTEAVDDFIAKLAKPAMENFVAEAQVLENLFLAEKKINETEDQQFEPYDWDFYRNKYLDEFHSKNNADENEESSSPPNSPNLPPKNISSNTNHHNFPLEEYFELENVLQNGLFFAASKLYKMSFREERDETKFPKYHPDLRIFSVFLETDDVHSASTTSSSSSSSNLLGHVVFDFFERSQTKYPGACIYLYRQQSKIPNHEMRPIIGLYLNFHKKHRNEDNASSYLSLLSQSDIISLFHEFGHTLHALHSQVKYPTLSCTENLANDYVEFPSKVNEHFAFVPEVLANYAKHYRTGEKLPQEIFDSLTVPRNHQAMLKKQHEMEKQNDCSEKFELRTVSNVAYETLEFIASAALDQSLHRLSSFVSFPDNSENSNHSFTSKPTLLTKDTFSEFEIESLKKFSVYHRLCPPRYLPCFFSHIICWAYPATYIGYLLSECIDCDATEWFFENGETNNPENGERMKNIILRRGSTEDPKKLLWEFFGGREVRIEPLLMRRGLMIC